MITFHLGVIDIPYEDEDTTTGDVAEYLEEKYQIMQTFFDRYGNDIADLMSKDLAASLENMFAGAPPAKDPLAESMSKVHDLFVGFLCGEVIVSACVDHCREKHAKPYGTRIWAGQAVSARLVGK
ncbi:Uncharacterised protein [Klebsiella pneumoniae]|uniref:hypothetical protein n=1 Tax=Klebsiella pneumoniae TaxID=573 RepID=UPI000E2BA992|nr:hypothetical protein [Klebsiella pneumoniae]SYP56946.1 Uncharacterised protein [Klebsiella pneumoniae]